MSDEPPPLLSVVRGDPSAAELAALLIVLAGKVSHDVAGAGPVRPSSWARSSFHGGACWIPPDWRSSGLPA